MILFWGKIKIVFFFSAGRVGPPHGAGDLDRDREVLSLLYNSTGGPDWNFNEGWGTDSDLGSWYGVTINETSQLVEEVELYRNNLRGGIVVFLRYLFHTIMYSSSVVDPAE